MVSFEVETISQDEAKKEMRILVKGFLDAYTVNSFEKIMENFINKANVIYLDFSELDYISSAGIGSLMHYTKVLRDKGGDLIIIKPTEKVYKILDLLGFCMIFTIKKEG